MIDRSGGTVRHLHCMEECEGQSLAVIDISSGIVRHLHCMEECKKPSLAVIDRSGGRVYGTSTAWKNVRGRVWI